MNLVRAVATGVILADLALLAAAGPIRNTLGRYALAERQREIRNLIRENRELLHRVALARRPEEVARRAASFGIRLDPVERDGIDRPGGGPPVGRAPMAWVPRR